MEKETRQFITKKKEQRLGRKERKDNTIAFRYDSSSPSASLLDWMDGEVIAVRSKKGRAELYSVSQRDSITCVVRGEFGGPR
jgi:hypothetical protein